MNILICGLNYHPELIGVGKYTGEMVQSLVDRGHQITVVTTPPYYPEWKIAEGYSHHCFKTEETGSLRIIRCPLWVPAHVTGFSRLLHLTSFGLSSLFAVPAAIHPTPDIIISIAPTLLSAPAALLAGKLTHTRTWLHIQDFELDAALELGILQKSSLVRELARHYERWVLTNFAHLSSISQPMVDRLILSGVPAEKTILFPNWVDTEVIYPLDTPNSFRQRLGLSKDDLVVLYSGNMGVKQGLEVVIDAARLLRSQTDIHFVLCGDGPFRDTLQKKTSDYPNAHFLPLQPVERLNELLNMADIHLLPQKSGASDLVMPSKLLGMMASGKPVIAGCEEGSQLQAILKSTGIPVASEDANSISASILQLRSDPGLRIRLGNRGRSYVIENYSKKVVVDHFISILEGLQPSN